MGLMTLTVRNGIFHFALGLLLAFSVVYGWVVWGLVSREGWQASVGGGSLWGLVLQTAVLPFLLLGGFLAVRRAFRKSAAPETFFFALFLVTQVAECLLIVEAWLLFSGGAAYYTSVLTRVVWAFRCLGLSFLFVGSLFGFSFAFRRFGSIVLWCLAVSTVFAVLLPLHSTSARNHLLYAVGDPSGMVLVTILVATLVAVNYAAGARQPGAPAQARRRAWAAVCFLAAWALSISFGPWGTWLTVPGALLAAWGAEENPVYQ